jgi:uncharacterized membrane protein YkvA (DUF1232 family)
LVSIRVLPRYLLTGRFLQVFTYLPQFASLYWRLFRDRRVSRLAKAWLVLTFIYLVSPIDLLPIWLAPLGQLDDLVVLIGGLWMFVRMCPPEAVWEHVRTVSRSDRPV